MTTMLGLSDIREQMSEVVQKDEAPVVVDRLQFLEWVVSLDQILDGPREPLLLPDAPFASDGFRYGAE